MAVYTVLDKQTIERILQKYEIGRLCRFEAISSGIENSNYFIWVEVSGQAMVEYVLTIFENIAEASLPFFNELTAYLQLEGFLVPAPVVNRDGQASFSLVDALPTDTKLFNKLGVIVPKLTGISLEFPNIYHCRQIAAYVANMHHSLDAFKPRIEVDHSLVWCTEIVNQLKGQVSAEDASLLMLALDRYRHYQDQIKQCASGIVHGDLFRDNVLFDGASISGIIDFYHAGHTAYLFDLAVIANDWAIHYDKLPAMFIQDQIDAGQSVDNELFNIDLIYDEERLDALVSSYASIRPFSEIEWQTWPRLLELAAFRFWLSRLKTMHLGGYQQEVKQGEVIKSPLAMKLILMSAMKR